MPWWNRKRPFSIYWRLSCPDVSIKEKTSERFFHPDSGRSEECCPGNGKFVFQYLRTEALETFKKTLGGRRYRAIFIQIGEVGCGIVLWRRCMKYGESAEFQPKGCLGIILPLSIISSKRFPRG
jgi:hypothetical protein